MGKIDLLHCGGVEKEKEKYLARLVLSKSLRVILENTKANRGKTRRQLLEENEDFQVGVSPLDFNPDYDQKSKRTNPLSFVTTETSIVYFTDNEQRTFERDYAGRFLTASCVDTPGDERNLELVESLKLGIKDCVFCILKEDAFNLNYSGKLFYRVEKVSCAGDSGLCSSDFDRQDSRLKRKAHEARIRDEKSGPPIDLDRALGKELIQRLREKGFKL